MSEIPSVEEIAGRFARLQEQVRGAEAAAGRLQESVQTVMLSIASLTVLKTEMQYLLFLDPCHLLLLILIK